MHLILAILLLPIIFAIALLGLVVGLIGWLCGAPVTLQFGQNKEVYRWFTRIK